MAKITQAPNNPFACASNAVKMHTVGPCCGSMLAVYSYEVTNAGQEVTFYPLTGNTSADLKYYRWSVVDKYGNTAGGGLDLSDPTQEITINTSTLDASGPFKVKFSACKSQGQEDAALSYDIMINDLASNPTGTSTPTNYKNVSFVLKLVSTDDANFVNFPSEGVEAYNGQAIDLNDYLDGATQLVKDGSYLFSLEALKCWYEPTLDEPTLSNADVILSAVAVEAFPLALTNEGQIFWNPVTIKTDTSGVFSTNVNAGLNAEDVQPTIYFTLKINVA